MNPTCVFVLLSFFSTPLPSTFPNPRPDQALPPLPGIGACAAYGRCHCHLLPTTISVFSGSRFNGAFAVPFFSSISRSFTDDIIKKGRSCKGFSVVVEANARRRHNVTAPNDDDSIKVWGCCPYREGFVRRVSSSAR